MNMLTRYVEYFRPVHQMKHDYDACNPYQWVRETIRNAMEANATKIHFGLEWQAVEKLGNYRRVIADNGGSISADNLLDYFCNVGDGGKVIDGEHDNFGVGSKISLYWWNPDGIVILAYQHKIGHMIKIVYDEVVGKYKPEILYNDSGKPVLVKKLGKKSVDSDGIDWSVVAPDWVRQNQGTVLVLLGNKQNPHTALGDISKGENRTVRGIIEYINSRFWDLKSIKVSVDTLPEDKSTWPTSYKEYTQKIKDGVRSYTRNAEGAKHYAEFKWKKGMAKGFLKDKGTFYIDDNKVLASYFLWEGEQPDNHQAEFGYVAVRYDNELYDLKGGKAFPHSHRPFGIVDKELKKRIIIIFEPQISDGTWGVSPQKSRSTLRFIDGPNSPKKDLPMEKWAHEFALNMPTSIQAEIIKNAGKSFELDDQIELEKVGGKFSDIYKAQEQLFKDLVTIAGSGYKKSKQFLTQLAKKRITPPPPDDPRPPRPPRPEPKPEPKPRPEPKPVKVINVLKKRNKAIPDPQGKYGAEEVDVILNLPRYRWDENAFDEASTNAATWNRNDPGNQAIPDIRPTVVLNPNHIFFKVLTEEFKKQWPLQTMADVIEMTMRQQIGQLAILQVAHICRTFPDLPENVLDTEYFTDESLTHGLAGLVHLEALVYQKLRDKLGKPLKAKG